MDELIPLDEFDEPVLDGGADWSTINPLLTNDAIFPLHLRCR